MLFKRVRKISDFINIRNLSTYFWPIDKYGLFCNLKYLNLRMLPLPPPPIYLFTHHLQLIGSITRIASRPSIYALWHQHGKIPAQQQGQSSRVLIRSWALIRTDSPSIWCNITNRWPHLQGLLRASIYASYYMLSLLQATEGQKTKAQRAYPY